MARFKIGVMSNGFRLPPREGVAKAAELGADGVQVYATRGEISPEQMGPDQRREFRGFVSDLGLEISALCGDMGKGFVDPQANPELVDRSRKIVDLAVDLGTAVVTTHVGVVPEDHDDPTYGVIADACRAIASHAEQAGVSFAIETGPEKATTLKALLDDIDSPGLGVNMDPANLVMVVADDPAEAVRTFGTSIVHTHAKDGIQLRPVDPHEVYHGSVSPEDGPGFREVPLGEGGVDWDAYLQALSDVGFGGYLTIEREVGDDPAGDIGRAVEFLRSRVG